MAINNHHYNDHGLESQPEECVDLYPQALVRPNISLGFSCILSLTFTVRYTCIPIFIIPVSFIAYTSTSLGTSSLVRNPNKKNTRKQSHGIELQSIVCATRSLDVQERGMVWPLAAEVFIGTCCWIASFVATVRVRISFLTPSFVWFLLIDIPKVNRLRLCRFSS